ncbi:MAG TPA: hypothetical protein VHX11_02930 [Acidobacteriaceae bacterium]|jgi:hypothetical protein|nr:hypothetical protein [Acidobacteriaceae bacterium]
MSNPLLPIEERTLSPDQVVALDQRRHRGLLLLVISGQFAIISTILLLWVGQDATYAPGWAHPTDYYFAVTIAIAVICGISGKVLRRGSPIL